MANNRIYLVDTVENEYLCIAKGHGCAWSVGNVDLYKEFMTTRFTDAGDETNLIIGTENDTEFHDKWLKNGKNFNTTNKWE